MRTGGTWDADGIPVNGNAAENLSTIFACVQVISETVAMLPLGVYRKTDSGRLGDPSHPVSRIFAGDANEFLTAPEFVETMTAHCLLRGNAYAGIVRDGRGAPIALNMLHPDMVSLVRIPRTNTYRYDVSMPEGGTKRLLASEVLHLKDRSDDGIIGVSRLRRAREAVAIAVAAERYAGSMFRHGASLSGVLSHPEAIGDEAAERLRQSFQQTYSGADRAGSVAILEEGLKWTAVSVSPDDAQALESRAFNVQSLCRLYRVPPEIVGHRETTGSYGSLVEIHRIFYSHCIQPWLNRWERQIERALFSEEGRRTHEVEFDTDLLLRGDALTRLQSYRVGREVGLYSANELRRFENLNPRTDAGGDTFFEPRQMSPEQTNQPAADRGGDA